MERRREAPLSSDVVSSLMHLLQCFSSHLLHVFLSPAAPGRGWSWSLTSSPGYLLRAIIRGFPSLLSLGRGKSSPSLTLHLCTLALLPCCASVSLPASLPSQMPIDWIAIDRYFKASSKLSDKTSRCPKHIGTLCWPCFSGSLMCLNPRQRNDQQQLICDAKWALPLRESLQGANLVSLWLFRLRSLMDREARGALREPICL